MQKVNITDKEKIMLELYRKLSDENKITVDILIERLISHECQEESNAKGCNM